MDAESRPEKEGKQTGKSGALLLSLWKRVYSIGFKRLGVSFLLAGIMWFTANYESDLEKNVEIPINYIALPQKLAISNRPDLPSSARLRIRGSRSQVSAVLKTNTAINIDLSRQKSGVYRYEISPELVSLPRNVRIIRMSPRNILLDIDNILEKFVVVRANAGEPGTGYTVNGEVWTEPAMVMIKGPGKTVKGIREVETIPIPIANEKSKFSVDATLVSPDSLVEFSGVRSVKVNVDIAEIISGKNFENLVVEIRNLPKDGTYKTKPERAEIRFEGPQSLITNLNSKDILIYADAKALQETLESGSGASVKLHANYPYKDKLRITRISPGRVTIKKSQAAK